MLGDLWNALVRTALIGTDRTAVNILDNPAMKKYAQNKSTDPETQLLETATVISHLIKCGYQPAIFKESISPFNIAEPLASAGRGSSEDLKAIIYGNYEQALPEYLRLLAENKKRVPDEMLPDILEYCRTKPVFWDPLTAVVGEKGAWLTGQNPDWQYLTTPLSHENWEKSTLNERLSILKQIRKYNPGTAVELIRTTWDEDSIQDRSEILKMLSEGLGPEDEAFLEECLDNRRKEVRKLAARLLAKLPGSQLSGRVFGRLNEYLSIKRRKGSKPRFSIILPEKCGQEMIRDGVDPGAQWFKGGVKVSRLGQMISVTPPKFWETRLGSDAASSLKVFVRSEWSEMLVQALIEAAAFHSDDDWMIALLDFGFEGKDKSRFQDLNFSPVINKMTGKVFNEVSSKWIASEKDLLPENHLACQILKVNDHPWNDKLTLAITSALSNWMGFETSRYWNGWHYRGLLKKAAYLSRPGIVDKMAYIWPRNSRIWQSWEKEIDDFLETLKFRKQMHANILK